MTEELEYKFGTYPDLEHAVKELEKIRLDPRTRPEKRQACEDAIVIALDAMVAQMRQTPGFGPQFEVRFKGRVEALDLVAVCNETLNKASGRGKWDPQAAYQHAAVAARSLLDSISAINEPGPGETIKRVIYDKDGVNFEAVIIRHGPGVQP